MAWFPLGEFWHNLVEAIRNDNVTQIVDGGFDFFLMDSASVVVETTVTGEAGWISFGHAGIPSLRVFLSVHRTLNILFGETYSCIQLCISYISTLATYLYPPFINVSSVA